MKRYTRKDIYSEGYELEDCGCQGEYMPMNDDTIPDMIDKLGELEDIEEELGCSIEVVFKALKEGSCGSIIAFLQNDYNEVYQKGLYKPLIINGLSRICNTNEWCFCCYDSLTLKGYTFYLKDYQKTWWLKEDRSE